MCYDCSSFLREYPFLIIDPKLVSEKKNPNLFASLVLRRKLSKLSKLISCGKVERLVNQDIIHSNLCHKNVMLLNAPLSK